MGFNTFKCEYCHEKTNHHNTVIMDGTDDIYVLDVCNKCAEQLNSDYWSPEDVDIMFK